MATYTPPPYFPQTSLTPPDKHRYLKFKLIVGAVLVAILMVLIGLGWAVWHWLR